eukprot:4574065-Karenia_brevis.AAC.1
MAVEVDGPSQTCAANKNPPYTPQEVVSECDALAPLSVGDLISFNGAISDSDVGSHEVAVEVDGPP